MKFARYIMLLFFILFSCLSALCSDFDTIKLNNGQTLIIKEVHDNPIVTIDTWIKTGSINENDKNNGVSHFLEHLFFKGTKNYPTGEFDKIIESKGAITNAATSKDYTHYYITLPSKDFDLAINMHADMLLHPAIPPLELEKERKVVTEEIARSNDSPDTKLFENLNTAFYKSHPYKRKVIGTNDIIANIKREEILQYYNTHYLPQNMITVIVGDVNKKNAIKKVEELFKANAGAKYTTPIYQKETALDCPKEIIKEEDVQNAYLLMGFRTTDVNNKEEEAALDVLATILGGGKTSRLYQNIKEKNQLAFSVNAGHSAMRDDGMFLIKANYKPENYGKLKALILKEIDNIKNTPVSEKELNKAKNMLERDTYYSRESISNISNELGYIATVFGDTAFYDNYIPMVKNVTAQQVSDIAKKYLDENKMVISVLNPKFKEIKNTSKTIQKTKTHYSPIKTVGKVSKYKLDNKSTLLINKNTANDIIAISIFAKGGEFLENKAGVGALTASGMLKSTKKYSTLQLQELLEENGIEAGITSSGDVFTISLKSTKNELPIVFDVLNEIVNNALFSEDEIQKIKTEKLAAIQKSRDNPANVAFEEFKAHIWGDYPYANTGLVYEKTIPSITTSEIKDFYSKIFYPENIVISINGNVNADEAAMNFEKIFKDKKGSKINLADFKKENKFFAQNQEIKKSKKSEASWLVIGWQTSDINNLKDWTTLKVIGAILGGGMSSRLFFNLRDKQGLAYQVGSSHAAKANNGVFAIYIGTNPKNIEVAKQGLLNEIEILKKTPVCEDELQKIKEKILGNYVLSQETNMQKALTSGEYETILNDFNFSEKYKTLINSVTQSDILNVANKYFSKPYLFVLVGE